VSSLASGIVFFKSAVGWCCIVTGLGEEEAGNGEKSLANEPVGLGLLGELTIGLISEISMLRGWI
jgi:hypothetical protein